MADAHTTGGGSFRLLVIAPEKIVIDRAVESVRLPGVDGSFGILAKHAPMIAAIEAGEMVVRAPGGAPESFFVSDGFVEVRDDVVRVVVESGEHRGEIDVERAQESEKRAREKIAASTKQVDVDLPRAEAALRRARARERLARKPGA
ncbi:MAG TPA: ATP synthase F1 subunit epsilon [Planctomycetota bacterium]|nr:ATP synthase F1 subunit epsilon [Planctomycetota bacterium]